ncbi:glycosyltransferase family 1 protein [Clostridium butyricum]|uniref:glycosyltransferase family 1 protein n=1 Tax=Clostridium butyricum TaxID=1492 RepID=UPI0022E3D54D|nr:glycosyltransferase family 1 protein [Clostridium butyricum]
MKDRNSVVSKEIKNNITELIDKGYIDIAKMLLEDYKKLKRNDTDIYSIEALIHIINNDYESAEEILQKGLKMNSSDYELNYNMGYVMQLKQYNDKANEYYLRAKLFNKETEIQLIESEVEEKSIENLGIVQGSIEIANQMNMLNTQFKKMGIKSTAIDYYPSYLKYDSEHRIDINKFNSLKEADIATKELAAKLIAENDIFHFHFGTTLTLDNSDLSIIKELGKKVIMQYWGSDVRMLSKAKELNPYAVVKDVDEDNIKRKLEYISKHIPNCIVDYELAEYVKDYHENIFYSRVGMDLSKYKPKSKNPKEKMCIVHAPTSTNVKGTYYILEAIENLKEKYDFEFILVQNMSHCEAVKTYQKADLIIDQILLGSYGVFAVESMAMGKPVIGWISDFMKEKYPKELPIISANPDNIEQKIEYVINNRDMLKKIGIDGRKYVEKYHDINVVTNNIIDIYKKI